MKIQKISLKRISPIKTFKGTRFNAHPKYSYKTIQHALHKYKLKTPVLSVASSSSFGFQQIPVAVSSGSSNKSSPLNNNSSSSTGTRQRCNSNDSVNEYDIEMGFPPNINLSQNSTSTNSSSVGFQKIPVAVSSGSSNKSGLLNNNSSSSTGTWQRCNSNDSVNEYDIEMGFPPNINLLQNFTPTNLITTADALATSNERNINNFDTISRIPDDVLRGVVMDYLTPKDLLNLSSVNKSYRHLANNYSRQRQQELVNKSGITGLNSETNINGNYIITMIILKRSIDFLKRNNINDFSSPAVTLNAFRLLYSPPTLNPFRLASNRPTHIIRDFIKLGVGVNVTDERGCTALHYAAQYGHTTIVQHLIELGADVNLTDRYGWTPLHNAASNGHTTIVQHLIEHGANVNVTNGCGWTPLHYAARCGRANVVQHLIDRGADMNLEVNSNDTMFFAECLFNSLTPLDLTYDTMATIIHPFFILTIPISIYFDKNLLQRLRDTEQVLLNAGARSHGIHSHFKVHYICWSIFLATFIIRAIKKHT